MAYLHSLGITDLDAYEVTRSDTLDAVVRLLEKIDSHDDDSETCALCYRIKQIRLIK